MNFLLYSIALAVLSLLRILPLRAVARLGRVCGFLFYRLDARHRKVALRNLELCFGSEKSSAQLREIARENFMRIGENFACAAKTAFLPFEKLRKHVEFVGSDKLLVPAPDGAFQSCVVGIGHFGNFEIYARLGQILPGFRTITTYRGLRQPALNRLLQSLRQRSGCEFFERRTEASALKAAMRDTGVIVGFLADQHAGGSGVRVPLLGHPCSTTTAPAIFALRYDLPLFTGICYRVGLAQWRIEAGDRIPTRENGEARSVESITADMNQAFEKAIRRDPANWFWVHDRWKPARRTAPLPEPA
jgi:lauroyl/myristoyl acyltransferase